MPLRSGSGSSDFESTLPRVAELPLGGTAVGTGINTPPGFSARVIEILSELTELPLTEARNHFEAQGSRDALVEASGQLRTIAVGLHKICTDLRWMGSGPRAGLGEIRLPDLQPGSSIMPGKVNPGASRGDVDGLRAGDRQRRRDRVRRRFGQLRAQRDDAGDGGQSLGLDSLLTNASRLLADRCIDGIEADVEHCRELAESSPSVVTPLNRYIGYENAAAVAKRAVKERRTIRDIVIDEGYVERGDLTVEQLDAALDVLSHDPPLAGKPASHPPPPTRLPRIAGSLRSGRWQNRKVPAIRGGQARRSSKRCVLGGLRCLQDCDSKPRIAREQHP